MNNREKIIDKIKKLKAHAASAEKIGSEQEAQAFAAAMQRLMSEHKVLMSEVEHAKLVETRTSGMVPKWSGRGGGVGKKKFGTCRVWWLEQLAATVAKAHWCKTLVSRHCAVLYFVGRKSDGEAALEAFEYLADVAATLAHKAYGKAYAAFKRGEGGWQSGFHQSWLIGFTERLSQRYEEELERMRAEWASSGTALVRLDGALAPVKEFMAKQKYSTADQLETGIVTNEGAYRQGRQAAEDLAIGRKVKKVEGAE